ncbi:MAG: hypothetical protein LQ338_007893 [Usnochroma carphineum]|nr:MAG: hypothetical protein LQ338_007893 [Usnochroma carphineum]
MAVPVNHWITQGRYNPLINVVILMFSVAAFGLAASYASAAIKTPINEDALNFMEPRPPNGQIIVYSAFMPFFSMIQSMLDLSLHFLVGLHPIYSLVISIIYFSGWLTQWTIWMDCEITGIGFENDGDRCFQVKLDHRLYSMVPSRSSDGIVNGRVGLGAIIIALYVAYGVLAALALTRNRRGQRLR